MLLGWLTLERLFLLVESSEKRHQHSSQDIIKKKKIFPCLSFSLLPRSTEILLVALDSRIRYTGDGENCEDRFKRYALPRSARDSRRSGLPHP